MPPIGWLKAVRKICDDLEVLHDRRRGHHRLRPHRPLVRGRARRRGARHHVGRQGHHLRLCPALRGHRPPKARRRLPRERRQENVHPNTYAAHPVACAAGLANLQIMQQDNLVQNAEAMGKRLLEACGAPSARPRSSARCGGAASWCAPSSSSPTARAGRSTRTAVAQLDQLAWDRGAIVYARDHVLRLAPPLCITAAEVDQLVGMVAESINAMEKASTRYPDCRTIASEARHRTSGANRPKTLNLLSPPPTPPHPPPPPHLDTHLFLTISLSQIPLFPTPPPPSPPPPFSPIPLFSFPTPFSPPPPPPPLSPLPPPHPHRRSEASRAPWTSASTSAHIDGGVLALEQRALGEAAVGAGDDALAADQAARSS